MDIDNIQVTTGEVPKHTRNSEKSSKYLALARRLAEDPVDPETQLGARIHLDADKANSVATQLRKIGQPEGWRFRTVRDPNNPEMRFVYCSDNDFDFEAYEAEKMKRRLRTG